jgi:hypothetical protein
MKPLMALFLCLAAGCSEKPSRDKAQTDTTQAAAIDEVKAEKKSIEEAANAAAKLVEEEANAEIEALKQEK